MSKEVSLPRFGPERWVTIRDTGEHVKIEAWSGIAAGYRVRSKSRGIVVVPEHEIEDVPQHPEVHLGKHWNRCPAAQCGAPLTPELPICPRCKAPTCTCGRCRCARPSSAAPRVKKSSKKKAKSA